MKVFVLTISLTLIIGISNGQHIHSPNIPTVSAIARINTVIYHLKIEKQMLTKTGKKREFGILPKLILKKR